MDTNALLWQVGLAGGGRLGPRAKKALQSADTVYVSSVALAEIQIKTMLGKLDAPVDCVAMVKQAGNTLLDLTAESADTIRHFPDLVRHDPFDRLLLAQAYAEGLTLLTADSFLLGLDLPYVVDARV